MSMASNSVCGKGATASSAMYALISFSLPSHQSMAASASSSSRLAAALCSSDSAPRPCAANMSTAIARRQLHLAGLAAGLLCLCPAEARAGIEEEYKVDTEKMIKQVRETLNLDKEDPSKGQAVKALRSSSNDWVAKYRREKRFQGKPSYGNMYSVLNAVSGHYISYGDGAPIPTKRKTLILDEVDQAERSLARGR